MTEPETTEAPVITVRIRTSPRPTIGVVIPLAFGERPAPGLLDALVQLREEPHVTLSIRFSAVCPEDGQAALFDWWECAGIDPDEFVTPPVGPSVASNDLDDEVVDGCRYVFLPRRTQYGRQPSDRGAAGQKPVGTNAAWVAGPAGRGRQMNRGALALFEDPNPYWLCFLHADTVPHRSWAPSLASHLLNWDVMGKQVGYAWLWFASDGPWWATWLNAVGANVRSFVLGWPYGDQALYWPAKTFHSLGGFREDLERGEDFDLVLRSRREGYKLGSFGGWVVTSARRYREHGWWRTTIGHWIAMLRLRLEARKHRGPLCSANTCSGSVHDSTSDSESNIASHPPSSPRPGAVGTSEGANDSGPAAGRA